MVQTKMNLKRRTKKVMGKRRGGRRKGTWEMKGDALKDWRVANKLSRASLGKLLKVSSTTIQNWEKGIAIPMPGSQNAIKHLMMHLQPAAGKPISVESEMMLAAIKVGEAITDFLRVVAKKMEK